MATDNFRGNVNAYNSCLRIITEIHSLRYQYLVISFLKKLSHVKASYLSNFYPNISFTFEKNNRLHNYIKFVIIRLKKGDRE